MGLYRLDSAFTLAGGHTFNMSYSVVSNGVTNSVDKTDVCWRCHGEIDSFLQERAGDGGQVSERRDDHRHEADSHADHDALPGDGEGAAPGVDGIGDPVDPVDGDDGIGRLRGDGCAGGPHRDPDVGECQCRRVVDSVADHHHLAELRIVTDPSHDLELVLRRELGVDAVEPQLSAHALGDRSAVARRHCHVANSLGT